MDGRYQEVEVLHVFEIMQLKIVNFVGSGFAHRHL